MRRLQARAGYHLVAVTQQGTHPAVRRGELRGAGTRDEFAEGLRVGLAPGRLDRDLLESVLRGEVAPGRVHDERVLNNI